MRKTKILAAALALSIALTGCAFAEGTWYATGAATLNKWATGTLNTDNVDWKDAKGTAFYKNGDDTSQNWPGARGNNDSVVVEYGTSTTAGFKTAANSIDIPAGIAIDLVELNLKGGVLLKANSSMDIETLKVDDKVNTISIDVTGGNSAYLTIATLDLSNGTGKNGKLVIDNATSAATTTPVTIENYGLKWIPTGTKFVTLTPAGGKTDVLTDGNASVLYVTNGAVVEMAGATGNANLQIKAAENVSVDVANWGNIILTDGASYKGDTGSITAVAGDSDSQVALVDTELVVYENSNAGSLVGAGSMKLSGDVKIEGKLAADVLNQGMLVLVANSTASNAEYFTLTNGNGTELEVASSDIISGTGSNTAAGITVDYTKLGYIDVSNDGIKFAGVSLDADINAKGTLIVASTLTAAGSSIGANFFADEENDFTIQTADGNASITVLEGAVKVNVDGTIEPADAKDPQPASLMFTSTDIEGLTAVTGDVTVAAAAGSTMKVLLGDALTIGKDNSLIIDTGAVLGQKEYTFPTLTVEEGGVLGITALATAPNAFTQDEVITIEAGGTLQALGDLKADDFKKISLGDGAILAVTNGQKVPYDGLTPLTKKLVLAGIESTDVPVNPYKEYLIGEKGNLVVSDDFNSTVKVADGGILTVQGPAKSLEANIESGGTLAIAAPATVKALECAEGAKVDVTALLEGLEAKTYESTEINGEVIVEKALTIIGGTPTTLPTDVEGVYYFYAPAASEGEGEGEGEGEEAPTAEGDEDEGGEGDEGGETEAPEGVRYEIAVALKANADGSALDIVASGDVKVAPEDKPEPTPGEGEGKAPDPDILDDPECAPAIENGTDANGAPVTVTPHATKDGVYIVNVTEATELPLATLPYTFKLPLIEGGKLVLGDGKDAKAVVDDKAEDDPFEYTIAGEKVSLNIGRLIKEKAAEFELFFRFPKATLEAAGTTPTAATGEVETEKLTVVVGEGVLKVKATADPTTINYTDDADEETEVTASVTRATDEVEDATLMWTITDADGTVVTSDVLGSEPGANQNKELTIKASDFGLEKGAQAEFTFTVTATKGETSATSDPVKVKVVDSRTEGGSTPTQPGGSGSGGGGCAAGFAGLAFALVIPMFLKKR